MNPKEPLIALLRGPITLSCGPTILSDGEDIEELLREEAKRLTIRLVFPGQA